MTTRSIRITEDLQDPVDIIRDIVESGLHEDSFYILDVGNVVDSFYKWKEVMPAVKPYYAVKCNNHDILLKTLAALGAGFDCASEAEIEQVIALGVDPKRIILANPAKMPAHIRYCSKIGVQLMTFDSEFELLKIKAIMPHAQLLIRIRADAENVEILLGEKFGCNVGHESTRLLRAAADLGFSVVGVSFHVGSGAHDFEAFGLAIQQARDVFDVGATLGHSKMNLLDIGGGFLESNSCSITKVASIVNDAIAEYFSDKDIKVIAEPGRYFADSAFTLAVQVYSKREIEAEDNEEKEAKTMLFIQDGVYSAFAKTIFYKQKVTFEPIKICSTKVERYSIWGPTCSGVDCVSPSIELPSLSVGDWLAVRNMGAYTTCIASTFNGFPVPRVQPVIDRKTCNGRTTGPLDIIRDVVVIEFGVQEDPFCIFDVGNVVDSYYKWKKVMPDVKPYYDCTGYIASSLTMTAQSIRIMEERRDPVDIIRDVVESGVQEDPFYMFDVGNVVDSYYKWNEVMPDVKPFYAVKCNNDDILLKTLAALGAGFDCASKFEVEKVIALGVDPKRIIFAHPAKMPAHIKYCSKVGVKLMTFDSEFELRKIKAIMPHAQMVIRIRSDAVDADTPLGEKFGCNVGHESTRLLRAAADLDISVVGVSFHVGSGAHDFEAFGLAIQQARLVFDVGATLGHTKMNLLDIGGGFLRSSSCTITEVASIVNDAIAEYFSDKDIKVIAEPGRYFADSAFTLAVQVYSKREIEAEDNEEKEAKTMLFINESMYGSFAKMILHKEKVTFEPLKKCSTKVERYSIWGPTCSGVDCLSPSIELPSLSVGDWLAVRNMGAYTTCIASTFNGFPVPRVQPVIDRKTWSTLQTIWHNPRLIITMKSETLTSFLTHELVKSSYRKMSDTGKRYRLI